MKSSPLCVDRTARVLLPTALIASVLLAIVGCKGKTQAPEIVSLEGKVEKVKLSPGGGGQISIAYYSEKRGQEVIGTGLVTSETEIMINGAVATLADIRVGEQVRGQARVETSGGERKQIALKIYVDRAKPIGG